jgi:hypothetical protein
MAGFYTKIYYNINDGDLRHLRTHGGPREWAFGIIDGERLTKEILAGFNQFGIMDVHRITITCYKWKKSIKSKHKKCIGSTRYKVVLNHGKDLITISEVKVGTPDIVKNE